MRYEHSLTGPLSIRGMQALFDVAITRPTTAKARLHLYDRWCSELQRRALADEIAWMPATGAAATLTNLPLAHLQGILLRIVERTPVAQSASPTGAAPPGPTGNRRPPNPRATQTYVIRPSPQKSDATMEKAAAGRIAEWQPGDSPAC